MLIPLYALPVEIEVGGWPFFGVQSLHQLVPLVSIAAITFMAVALCSSAMFIFISSLPLLTVPTIYHVAYRVNNPVDRGLGRVGSMVGDWVNGRVGSGLIRPVGSAPTLWVDVE